jgi:hypothetical protein
MSVPQASAYTVMLKAFLSSDHVSPATGKTVAVTLSKAGGAFGNPSAGATNATEVANGWYSVALSTTDTGTVGDLVVRGTATGCDDSERLLQIVNANTGGLGNLDAAVSTRSAPGTAQTITANQSVNVAQWLGVAPNALQAGRVDAYLGAGAAGVITATLAPNLDAAVSTRSTYAGTDTAGTTTLLARLTAGRATNLDNLDAAVSTRSTLAAAGVWDLATAGHTTSGTFGAAMNAAGSAGDPWATTLPGAYGAGTAGNLVGNRLDAAVSSRLAASALSVDGSGRVTLAPAGLDAVAVEAGVNARQALSVIASATAGVLSGAATTSIAIAAANNPATGRIAATVDGSGNRTSVVLSLP